MTLIFERRVDGPATHALIVGIGRFPHLPGKDLGACVESAKAVLSHILEARDDLYPPLASVECILSDPSVRNGLDQLEKCDPVADPRSDSSIQSGVAVNVVNACDEWRKRCETGDSMFLYACSHGVAGRDERGLLVLEDYGSVPDSKGRHLLDISSIARMLAPASKASAVWIFVDACQEYRADLGEIAEGVRAIAPFSATTSQVAACTVDTLALIGSRFSKFARTEKKGVAFFTQALLAGMTGNCVEEKRGTWWVTGKQLQHGLAVTGRALGLNVQPSGLTSFIQEKRLKKVAHPKIPVVVTSKPSRLLSVASHASIRDSSPPFDVIDEKSDKGPAWRLHIPLLRKTLNVHLTSQGTDLVESFFCDAPAVVIEIEGQS